MGETLALLVGVIVVAVGGTLVVLQVTARQRFWSARSPAVALEVGDNWYRYALTLARLLEQLRRDDLVAVTIPHEVKAEIDATLKRFWDVQRVEE
jgi:hypothetical protein